APMPPGGLLDFSVAVALDGEPLSADETAQLLGAGEGLVRLRGRWVEADGERLQQALTHWRDVQQLSRQGVSFGEAMRLLLGFERAGLGQAADPVRAWSRVEAGPWLAGELARMRDPGRVADADAALGELRATLRPYQTQGSRWLGHLGALGLGACLADDMGLGKTLQVLGALLVRRRQHPDEAHLVVAPASLIPGWRAEAARFAPSLTVLTAHPSARGDQVAGPDTPLAGAVVLTTYGMLGRLPWLAERRWGMVVLDEAQAIKNASSRQSKLARSLAGAARVAVTGTPVENRPGELWPLFDFLNPGLLGPARSFGAFVRDAPKHPGALGRLRGLLRPYLLRRLKADVASDLPPKIDLDAWCLLTKRQAALYQAEVDRLAALLRKDSNDIARRGAILGAMTRLKQLCDHPSLLLGDNGFDPDDSGKFARLAELADEIAQRQEKALIFTQFRELTGPLLALLTRLFGTPGLLLHGGTPVPRRRQLVESFQRDDGPPFFVISLKAGGVGLTLTQASHVIHVDRWWNPAVEDQATDRAHRIGQSRSVMVHRLMCRGTLDERIDTLLRTKRAVVSDLLEGPAGTMLTELPDEELLRLVALDLSAVAGEG
ncbi:MAG: DEAD/DEAH box helicase, partial [Myxococcales bacterium]